jgi:hypothetical protein
MRARDVKGTRSDRIIAQKGRVLPKTLHAKYVWTERDPFLEADEDMEELAEKGETVYIGEYRLVKVRKVDLKLRVA